MNKDKLIQYELDYGGSDGNKERFTITAGSEPESLVKDYVEANGYGLREITETNLVALDLAPLEANALQVALDHFIEFIDDIVSQGEGDAEDREGDKAKQAAIKSLHAKVMAATQGGEES